MPSQKGEKIDKRIKQDNKPKERQLILRLNQRQQVLPLLGILAHRSYQFGN
jgi:hypothetical protein